MNNQKPGMFVPALVGGAAAGLLSAVPLVNCFCCLWIVGGAILAAYLLAKDSPSGLSGGDGAIVGVFTGLVAAVVDAIISLPLQAVNAQVIRQVMERMAEYSDSLPSGWENFLERGLAETSFAIFMLGLMISAIIFAALGALGGIIGAALFGKIPKPPETTSVPEDQTPSNR
ncbi:MAG: hypothetical protein ACOC57_01370 [Acidobacteriota bacterium]